MRTKIIDVLQSKAFGTVVNIKAWVRTRRGNKNVCFIALNDGSTINNIQVVVDIEKFGEEYLKPITTGACINVTGLLVESQGQGQTAEIQAQEIEIFGTADPAVYPLQKKRAYIGISAGNSSFASAHQYFRSGFPYSSPHGLCNS